MADVQIAIIDEQATEITLAVPGVQGSAGPGVPAGGTQNQLLIKQSGVAYDTAWASNVDIPGTLDVTGDVTFDQDLTLVGDITFGTGTGSKLGTGTNQKLAFYNKTPIVQPTTAIAEAAFVVNTGGTTVNVDSTFGGYTLQQVVQALQNIGILA